MDNATRYYKGYISDHNGYAKRLDLNKLPSGKYKIMVENGDETLTKIMKIEEEMIFFSK